MFDANQETVQRDHQHEYHVMNSESSEEQIRYKCVFCGHMINQEDIEKGTTIN
ncbi:hypothetical protein [Alicyclobacillus dauci]|uniref:Uncharacterized protein n=1 Tax=Alicyclobacillus dauci TaxID=1475485 RepID=A0ABY6Z5L5_9BACL|nr:hypothetical protein [Alicyclobacillus dauci]WAH37574.1 hypothetical protein NZD86_03320 [Alicyclobacillus dauci]